MGFRLWLASRQKCPAVDHGKSIAAPPIEPEPERGNRSHSLDLDWGPADRGTSNIAWLRPLALTHAKDSRDEKTVMTSLSAKRPANKRPFFFRDDTRATTAAGNAVPSCRHAYLNSPVRARVRMNLVNEGDKGTEEVKWPGRPGHCERARCPDRLDWDPGRPVPAL